MKRVLMLGSALSAVVLVGCSGDGVTSNRAALAQAPTRTPWQMHDGLEVTPANPNGLLQFSCEPAIHGDVCEYDVATVPPANDSGWGAAPDGETIGMDFYCGQSRVCQAPITCLGYGDFTYFQTFVNIPANVAVTEFTITFEGMDDGSRVSIYNSSYPGGLVVPGSYVFLGGSGTTNLKDYVVAGEVNRVVITQVDDCCCENHLHVARVVLNGEPISSGCQTAADCDDGDACTQDVCNEDGSCGHQAIVCDDQNACTRDTCDSEMGCRYVNQCPDCSAAAASVEAIWPPNHKLVAVSVDGVTDPQGQTTAIAIDGITQDEPTNTVGDGDTCPDADGVGTATALVRAERTGTKKVPGDGRVYHIAFTATDPDGYQCNGEVTTCVPHDQGNGSACIDEGPLYDSLTCN